MADRGLLRRARLDLPRQAGGHASATWRRSASTRRITSRWARAAAVLTDTAAAEDAGRSRSATGAATAGARRAKRTPAASASTGSSASCRYGYDHKYIYSPHRLQPEADRHAGRRRRRPAGQARRLHGGAARELQPPARGLSDLQEMLILPEATPQQRSELVRLPDRAAGGLPRRSRSRPALHERSQDCDAPAVRRQPSASARLFACRAPSYRGSTRARTSS